MAKSKAPAPDRTSDIGAVIVAPELVTSAAAERRLIAAERKAERRFIEASEKHAAAESALERRRSRLEAARESLRERQGARMAGPSAPTSTPTG